MNSSISGMTKLIFLGGFLDLTASNILEWSIKTAVNKSSNQSHLDSVIISSNCFFLVISPHSDIKLN